jgi:hypothetical protein
MNEYFSGTRPDLISMKSVNDLAPFIQHSENFNMIAGNLNNIESNINSSNTLKKFYNAYIKPNILPIIIILIFVSCIIIRYLSVNDNKKNKTIKKIDDTNSDDTNADNNSKSIIENFNPAKPVFSQVNHNNYVEPPIEDFNKTQFISDMDDELFNKIISRVNEPSVNLDNVPYIDPSVSDPLEYREQIQTSRDEWANQHDGLPNPFYGNNYISSTADAVDFTRNLNKQNMNMATRQIFG